jgi:predicted RNase H-like HicB family nuclease
MNLDIIVKPKDDGSFTVSSPNFPDCESDGANIDEALDAMIDKISDTVAENVRTSLKESFKDVHAKLSSNGSINVPFMMSKLPLSLN